MKISCHLLLAIALIEGAALRAEDLRFVVIGDTRPKFASENFRVFQSLIPRINQRKPALVINLGDLIYGYGLLSKEKQWDKYQQTIRAFEAPYYQTPGNHDVYSRAARRAYQRRFGRFYQSFNYGGCHFVLLNNCDDGRWGYLGPAQLAWLKKDLQATSAEVVLVFLHFPVWEPERVTKSCYEFWRDTLHPLFRASRVKAVFGGHYHSYGPTREFDGIRYFITGGGGAELRPDYRKAGGGYHFMEVTVRGGNVDVRVITEHGELSDAEADIMGGFQFADRNGSRIGLDGGLTELRAGVAGTLTLRNPYDDPLQGRADWNADSSTFQVEPRSMAVSIPPGSTAHIPFRVKLLRDNVSLASLPWIEFNVTAGMTRHRFHRAVVFLRRLSAPYRADLPVLDGRLPDWDGIPWLHLGDAPKPLTEIRAIHSKDTLVLAVAVPNVPTEEIEESGFPDALQVGFAHRESDASFTGDFLRLGFSRERGAATNDRTPKHPAGGAVPGVRYACREEGDRTVFEIAIPVSRLKTGSARAERQLVLSLSFPVPDGEPATPEPVQPAPNTFAYEVRYGGAALVPAHFVELILEAQKKRR